VGRGIDHPLTVAMVTELIAAALQRGRKPSLWKKEVN
jgi:hypothetical protein